MVNLSSRLELVQEGIQKCQTATSKVVDLKSHADPDVRELATAIHFLAFGVQQIALALADEGRGDDLPVQRSS